MTNPRASKLYRNAGWRGVVKERTVIKEFFSPSGIAKGDKPMSNYKWKQLIIGVKEDRFPSDREKYVKYSNLSDINRKMVNGYLKRGAKNPKKREQYIQGIADEMRRSSNERYELEDRR